MDEYTRKDIIIDPEDPRLNKAIGKKVYYCSDIGILLRYANENDCEGTLVYINKEEINPFTVYNENDGRTTTEAIIIKNEDPMDRYIPFDSMREFVDRANEVMEEYDLYLPKGYPFQDDVWLKRRHTEKDVYCMVTSIFYDDLIICDRKVTSTEDVIFNDRLNLRELYQNYIFVNGSPCGKLKEDING